MIFLKKNIKRTILTSTIRSLHQNVFLPSSAQPSQAATGGSQISWAEISFIITAQPPTHPGIVVEKDKKEKEKKISVNKIKKIFTLLKQNKTEKKKWLEFKSQKSECLDFILKKKIKKKKIKRKRKYLLMILF